MTPFSVLRITTTAFFLFVATAISAEETPMTGAEFDAYVTGRTLTFGMGGEVYGVEQFRSGRRTTWSFMGGECLEGIWYDSDDHICFLYDDGVGEQHCWVFWETENGLGARFIGDGPSTELYEVLNSPRPLICPGPQVGV